MLVASLVLAAALLDPRCANFAPEAITRDARGDIARSTAQRAAFIRMHPCPATGEVTGACPGWAVDHVVPLVRGGADSVGNLQWLPDAIKSCKAPTCKDRFEQRVYRCWP